MCCHWMEKLNTKNNFMKSVSVNKLTIVFIVSLAMVSCKKNNQEIVDGSNENQGFNSIFFNAGSTSIKGGNADSVEQIRKRLPGLNLNGPDAFWPDHKNFFTHAMGNINFPTAERYLFRLSCSGKILVRLNNVDLFNFSTPHDTTAETSQFVNEGKNIFEFEYYDGGLAPKIVLERSIEGGQFEVVPNEAYSAIDITGSTPAVAVVDSAMTKPNVLTQQEMKEGWKLLFDGKTTSGWHRYNAPGVIGSKWVIENDALTFKGRERFRYKLEGRIMEIGATDPIGDGGKDIVTDKAFGDFELKLDWKISEGGNSGIFYSVIEDAKYVDPWNTSPEMQVLDNLVNKDGLIVKHRAGDLYDLIACKEVTVNTQGQWNQARVVKNKGIVEHWLNGVKVVEYNINTPEWSEMIKKSKFSKLIDFATAKERRHPAAQTGSRKSLRERCGHGRFNGPGAEYSAR